LSRIPGCEYRKRLRPGFGKLHAARENITCAFGLVDFGFP
jgi:hypothetical protein